MKLPVTPENFEQLKSGQRTVEYRDAHITFVNEATGETITKIVDSVGLTQTSKITEVLANRNHLFTDDVVISFHLGDAKTFKQVIVGAGSVVNGSAYVYRGPRYMPLAAAVPAPAMTVAGVGVSPRGAVPAPSLLLHTLVENAIKHHQNQSDPVIRVHVRIESENGSLHIHVLDNGPGIADPDIAVGKGVGLSNTRQRLQALYGDKSTFELENRAEGGLHVHIALPLRSHAALQPA